MGAYSKDMQLRSSQAVSNKCECGCGEFAKKRFVSGHNILKNPNFIYKDGRAYERIVCEECSVSFERRADRKGGWKLCNICSHKRNGKERIGTILSNRKGEYLVCKVCEKSYYVSPSRIKAKFCSNKCQGLYQQSQPLPKGFITSIDNKGKKNGRYKDGSRIGTNISKKNVRLGIIERDGNWCLKCGLPGPGLHLHRVIYGSQGGKYETANCVLLCAVHHEEIHSNKTEWLPILQNHLKGSERYRQRILEEANNG